MEKEDASPFFSSSSVEGTIKLLSREAKRLPHILLDLCEPTKMSWKRF